MKKETPLMKQYNDIKSKYPKSILLFRVGDFYETFHEDAVIASKVLGIVLTKRGSGVNKETKLAGFPHHSLDTYLHKLVKAGHRVAICEQLENPKLTKKIVKRGVTDLITPGVSLNDEILTSKKNNFLAAINVLDDQFGLSLLDVSTGDFFLSRGSLNYILNLMKNFEPKEILISRKDLKFLSDTNIDKSFFFYVDDWMLNFNTALKNIYDHFNVKSVKGFGIDKNNIGLISASMILFYLKESHQKKLSHVNKLIEINITSSLMMDRFTISNLEILHSKNEGGKSLIEIIDRTKTAMGSRLLRRWLCFPSIDIIEINKRYSIVDELKENYINNDEFVSQFNSISDIERIVSKLINFKTNPRDLISLSNSLKSIDKIKIFLKKSKNKNTVAIQNKLVLGNTITKILDDYLNPDAPASINKGGVINKGINKELDNTRDTLNNSKKTLDEILEREIKKTGISSLKISFNNVFGFYLEVTNSHKDKVPTDWIRKQTLVNAERYITDELKIHENQILNAEEKILEIEYMEFNNLVRKIQTKIEIIQKNASCIAYLDCLLSFSHCADELSYVKPIVNDKNKFYVKNSRHPVIEHTLDDGKHYIPNDIELNDEDHQILMITGPNMSGKSAILRQVALIAILAQIGSYVPATELEMGFFDRIFTRVGASDNISQGESTFMVEMLESASIVNNISDKSLVVLDEIGRGTSTYDGISIAWGITQFLHENINRPKTLFATHYHELNMMADKFKRIKNFNVQVKETSKDVIFLRKLIPGGSAHSFGIHVAKMAGMPEKIINISKKILKKLEKSHSEKNKFDVDENSDLQLSFFSLNDDSYQNLKGELESIDMDNMTPIEALVKLSELKQKINKDDT